MGNIQAGPIYLDCNATAPMDPAVREVVLDWLGDVGNAGSRTHEYGLRARKAVERARDRVAAVVAARPDEVVFTSGATESNNLAILGLAPFGEANGRRHVVSTAIEHKGRSRTARGTCGERVRGELSGTRARRGSAAGWWWRFRKSGTVHRSPGGYFRRRGDKKRQMDSAESPPAVAGAGSRTPPPRTPRSCGTPGSAACARRCGGAVRELAPRTNRRRSRCRS